MTEMPRLLLLNPPSERMAVRDNYYGCSSKAGYYWPPIDLLALSGKLRRYFTLSVIDAVAQGLSSGKCMSLIKGFEPDIIVMLAGPVTLKSDLEFASSAGAAFKSRVFLSGGPLLFHGKEFLARYEFIDGVILNFVDNNLAEHILKAEEGYNILYRGAGGDIRGEEKIRCRGDFSYGVPAYEIFPLKRYRTPLAWKKPLTCVKASFGCPVGCGFCLYGRLPYAARSLDDLFAEFRYLKRAGIKEIMFSDPNFTVDRARVEAICKGISRHCMGIRWSAAAHAASIDRGLLRVMKSAGCHLLEIGVESGSDRILQLYGKNSDRRTVEKAFDACKLEGIDLLGYFIFGLPGESARDMRATLDLALELDPYIASFSVACPYLGTPLADECRRKGWIDPETEEFDSSSKASINCGGLTPAEVNKMKEYAYRKFYLRPGKILKIALQSLKRPPLDFLYYLWYFFSRAAMMGRSFGSRAVL